ncbi:MAG: magnesium/cobalt transporter CorA [Planctomycetales bacterium]|nr:magnesium/cobalt transporter CorA [Planctomycetales bacterium]
MFKKSHTQAGARPGTLIFSADDVHSRVRVIEYSREAVSESTALDLERLVRVAAEGKCVWIDVEGLGDEQLIRQITEAFAIHPLAIEDVINRPQRAKTESYGDQELIICRTICGDGPTRLRTEQVSVILGPHFVITFQEGHHDAFASVRTRIEQPDARLRQHGPDYLAYAVVDTIVDNYYPVLEMLGNWLERWEDAAVSDPNPELLRDLNVIKNRLANLRRSMWAQNHALQCLARNDDSPISSEVRIYFRDTHDHCAQTLEVLEMYREMASNLLNTYLTAVGQRTNEVMKVLTVVSSVFVPLTFIAGVYGMNFEFMPELRYEWGYPFVWLTMVVTATVMVGLFWRKRWLSFGTTEAYAGGVDVAELRGGVPREQTPPKSAVPAHRQAA